ncbi:uncharacterized protein LOC127832140 isoform X2 [Dreissena polymorpha]|uniref:uncharacterized protein LOC127832140 isoform X2 n=1 Tax=Dreissena polymorpha TaxID=45954 RepID=UPI0022656F10|nr:uncharacterized protein LOC127832140 isoform X2 [Dreissena polymorpha]
MSTVSKFRFALLRPKSKATNTGFLLAFIIGVLEADFISNPSSTWYDVYIKCRNSKQTMMNWRMWTDEKPVLKITNPVWLYGFEVRIPNENRYFKFDQLHSNMTAFVRCVNRTAFADIYKTLTFEEARKNCENRANGSHMELPLMNNNNIDTFSVSNDIIDTTLWIQAADVGKILNSEDLNVHCFVLNNHGELRKDNCTKSYSSVCVNATVHDTIQYSGQESKVPNYDPTSPSTTVTSSAGTSEFVTSLVTSETNDKPVMAEKIHIALICVGVAVVTALVVAVICCCIIKRKLNKHRRPTLSDGYPKTADSVNVKDAQHYEVSDISVYATPSDAEMGGHRTARPRSSIIEGEYDTISNSKATYKSKRQVAMVKAYSHVAIVPANQRRETDSNMENAYDVSTLNKQTIATISHQDGIGHVYGHLEVT